MNKSVKHYEIANATDAGIVRKVNEDYYGTRETLNGEVVVVCDGMGGHAGGETASRLAFESIIESLNGKLSADPLNALNEALLYANQVILEYTRQHRELKGMGSTCVVLLLKDNCGYYAHVGDSRIYLHTKNHLQRLTKDHSFVQSLVDAGAISPQDAESHPRKNEITNALGLERMQSPSLCQKPYDPQEGDILLLCTDGLTGMVSDTEIQEILGSDKSLYAKAKKLVQLANSAGGIDNITLQLLQFSGIGFSESLKGETTKVNKKVLHVAGVALLILCLFGALALMASGGSFGGGICQQIATFYPHKNLSAPSQTVSVIKVVPPAQNAEKDSLRVALVKKQRELEAQSVHQKAKDAQQAIVLTKEKVDRVLVLLKTKQEADASRNSVTRTQPLLAEKMRIGEKFAGGIVFDVDATGKHGLIAAKSDLSGQPEGIDEKLSGLYSWADAKAACNAFVIGDYGNWRLPSREELKKLLLKKSVVGGFRKGTYWSFSEKDGLSAWIQDFGNGNEFNDKKTTTHRVRPIRSF